MKSLKDTPLAAAMLWQVSPVLTSSNASQFATIPVTNGVGVEIGLVVAVEVADLVVVLPRVTVTKMVLSQSPNSSWLWSCQLGAPTLMEMSEPYQFNRLSQ